MDRNGSRRSAGSVLVVPALLVVCVFLLAPLGLILRFSLNRYDPAQLMQSAFIAENYIKIFSDSYYLGVLGFTAEVAILCMAIVLIFAFPVAYFIARASERVRGWLIVLTVLPLLLGNAVRSAAWMVVMGASGLVNGFFMWMGLVTSPIKILYTSTALIVALVSVLLPFAIITLQSFIGSIPVSLEEASRSLGHSSLRTVFSVVMPLALPGIVAAGAICFILTMNTYATSVLVGGASLKMMGPVVYDQIANVSNWPFGAALAWVLMATTLLLTAVSTIFLSRKYF